MPRTVLLADDSVTAQNMGRRILTDAGYEVITVNNGSAALKKIHEIRPDLIVLDVYMPGYGGLEVCQRLKESGDTTKIPVLLSVGKMEPFKADEAKRVRADAHIVKPFEASELLAALAKLEDRIVPQAESKGRKSKKPAFWHDEDSKTPRDWSDNAEYLAQVKERKSSPTDEAVPEPSPEEAAPAPSSKVGAFPLVHEATGELPVVPDSAASEEQSAPVALAPQAAVAEEQSHDTSSKAPAENAADKPIAVETETEVAVKEEDSSKTAPSAPRWIAENVALSAEEAALELEQEMRAAEAAGATQTNTTEAPTVVAEVAAADNQGAAFAAAAGASASSSTTSAVASTTDEAEPPAGTEAAAAWQNWQQIRETVMNVHTTEALAETVAEAAKGAAPAEETQRESHAVEASAQPTPAPEAQPSELDGALASIVDSVLAELKPKLMQEISKKLKK